MRAKNEGQTQKGEVSEKKELLEIMDKLSKIKKQLTGKLRDYQTIQNDLLQNRKKIRTVSTVQSEIERLKTIFEHAKKTLSTITPNQLDEISKYNNPPSRVKLVLEAVTYLLTGKKLGWDQIRSTLTGNDFIQKILKYDHSQVKPHVIEIVKNDYVLHPDWNVEKIRKASQAAGPLAEWVEMQIGLIKAFKQMGFAKIEMVELKSHQQVLEKNENNLQTEIIYLENEMEELDRRKTRLTVALGINTFDLEDEEDEEFDALRKKTMDNIINKPRTFTKEKEENEIETRRISTPKKDGSISWTEDGNKVDLGNFTKANDENTENDPYLAFQKQSVNIKRAKRETDFSEKYKKSKNPSVLNTSTSQGLNNIPLSPEEDKLISSDEFGIGNNDKRNSNFVNRNNTQASIKVSDVNDNRSRNGSSIKGKTSEVSQFQDEGIPSQSIFHKLNNIQNNHRVSEPVMNKRESTPVDRRVSSNIAEVESRKNTMDHRASKNSIYSNDKIIDNARKDDEKRLTGDRKSIDVVKRKSTHVNDTPENDTRDKSAKSKHKNDKLKENTKSQGSQTDEINLNGPGLTRHGGMNQSPSRGEMITSVTYYKNIQPIRITKSVEMKTSSSQQLLVFQAQPPQLVKIADNQNDQNQPTDKNDSLRTIFQKSFQKTFNKNQFVSIIPPQQSTAIGVPFNYPNIRPIRSNQVPVPVMIPQLIQNQDKYISNNSQSTNGPISMPTSIRYVDSSSRSIQGIKRDYSADRIFQITEFRPLAQMPRQSPAQSPVQSPRSQQNPINFVQSSERVFRK
jgi:hypothetical protein